MHIIDPLPHRYFTTDEGIGGRIKVRPEDFIVEEIPLYEPVGEGEHLYLRVKKRGVSHGELLSRVRRKFGVSERAIGYAGMKDKQAVTSQTISVHVREDPPDLGFDHDRIVVVWASRHRNKIKRGHLVGNRFSIRIREVDPLAAPAARRTLGHLEQEGVPSYFGEQRFGYRCNNHRIGGMLLDGDWSAAAAELLGTGGSPFPEYQRERRDLFDAGRYAEAARLWTPADRCELITINALARGAEEGKALRAIGGTMLQFWTSALVSAVFNRVLDQRIDDDAADVLKDGDLAWKHDSRAVFRVTPDALADRDLAGRLARLEVSPSGPLWGPGMIEPTGDARGTERAALAAAGTTTERITSRPLSPDGGRRPFRAKIEHVEVEGGIDEHGPFVHVVFDLPRGMYATVVLREIMKDGSRTQTGGAAASGARRGRGPGW